MKNITSKERINFAIQRIIQDRPPIFLLFSYWGAKHNNICVEEYFKNPNLVGRTQIELQREFKHDCYYTFYYASLEIEMMGGKSYFKEYAAPVVSDLIVKCDKDVTKLKIPVFENNKVSKKVGQTINYIKKNGDSGIPIIGVVISPFSLPIMQMGFSNYLNAFVNNEELLNKLFKYNTKFTLAWSKYLIESGVDSLVYFNPFASRSLSSKTIYERFGQSIDKEVRDNITVPLIYHTASASISEIIDIIIKNGFNGCCISKDDDFELIAREINKDFLLIGNLNGLEIVKNSIENVKVDIDLLLSNYYKYGNIIISDNHGELLWNTDSTMLQAIVKEILEYD